MVTIAIAKEGNRKKTRWRLSSKRITVIVSKKEKEVQKEKLPLPAAFATPGGRRRTVQRRMFIVDTGASYNLICRKSLSFDERSLIYESNPVFIRTANGVVETSEAVSIEVQQLGNEVLKFYVLEDTVDVTSAGQIVHEHGWSYFHEPGQPPMLSKPGRRTICCEENQCQPERKRHMSKR